MLRRVILSIGTLWGITLVLSGCGRGLDPIFNRDPLDFEKENGLYIHVANALPLRPMQGAVDVSHRGVPHITQFRVCSRTSTNWLGHYGRQNPDPDEECMTFADRVPNGENKVLFVPTDRLQEIYKKGNGRIYFELSDATQYTQGNYYECSGTTSGSNTTVEIHSNLNQRQVVEIQVTQGNWWSYDCTISKR